MKLMVAALICGTLLACGQPKLSDQDIQELREGLPGISEACLAIMRQGGIEAMPSRTEACFAMTSAQRWRGLWRNDFEGSRFCPAPAQQCTAETAGEQIWLSLAPQSRGDSIEGNGGLFAVDFIGRRTVQAGRFGHMGASDHYMLVDRVISIRQVEPRAADDPFTPKPPASPPPADPAPPATSAPPPS